MLTEDLLYEIIEQNEVIINLLQGIAQFTSIMTTVMMWLIALIIILLSVEIIRRMFGFFVNRI